MPSFKQTRYSIQYTAAVNRIHKHIVQYQHCTPTSSVCWYKLMLQYTQTSTCSIISGWLSMNPSGDNALLGPAAPLGTTGIVHQLVAEDTAQGVGKQRHCAPSGEEGGVASHELVIPLVQLPPQAIKNLQSN